MLQSEERAYTKLGVAMEYLPNSWNPAETFQIFRCVLICITFVCTALYITVCVIELHVYHKAYLDLRVVLVEMSRISTYTQVLHPVLLTA